MSEYTKRLHKFVNGHEFVRCFYGKCPDCGEQVFSVGDDVVGDKIKAKFICPCGKKWKETVYSPKMGRYKYPQALVEKYYSKKEEKNLNVLKLFNTIFIITPKSIKSKEVKRKCGQKR